MLGRHGPLLAASLLVTALGCGGRTGLFTRDDAGRPSEPDAGPRDAGHFPPRPDADPSDGGRLDAGRSGDGGPRCNDDTSGLRVLRDGSRAEEYMVVSIVDRGAPCGVYTFAHVGPLEPDLGPARVEVSRDGEAVLVHTYAWRQTVSDPGRGLTATLAFDGLFDLTVRNARPGTQNLYALRTSIFGGDYAVVLP